MPNWAPCGKCDCVDGEASFPRWSVDGEPLFPDGQGGYLSATRSCPRRLVSNDTSYLISLFRHYQAGHLYTAGGLAEQPALYLQAMQTIEEGLHADREG